MGTTRGFRACLWGEEVRTVSPIIADICSKYGISKQVYFDRKRSNPTALLSELLRPHHKRKRTHKQKSVPNTPKQDYDTNLHFKRLVISLGEKEALKRVKTLGT